MAALFEEQLTKDIVVKRLVIFFLAIIAILSSEVIRIANASCANSGVDTKPNILFIAVDDLRPELGCYGVDHVHSPNIDRLAQTATVFQRAYCQQSVCNPSRTSLMTGLRPDTIGVTGNHIHFRTNRPGVVTLPEHFKQYGYQAVSIGKLYHGVFPAGSSKTQWDTMGDPQSWSEPAIRFGPRYYYTEEGIESAKQSFLKSYKLKNAGSTDWTKKLVFGLATESPDVADNVLYDGKVADAAVEKLTQLKGQGKPFFLAVGFIKPHSPYIAPKKYFKQYDNVNVVSNQKFPSGAPAFAGHNSGELRRYADQPTKGQIPLANQTRVRQSYLACVSYIDAQIGRVLDELERQGLSGNTIVCLYGDHGYHLGEHGLWGKTTNFEIDTRVPLIVRAPGIATGGQVSDSLVELVDLYPTLSELAGLPVGKKLEGKSFVRILANSTAKTKEVALSQHPRSGGVMGYSMRTASHRLTNWIQLDSGMVRATELYEYVDGFVEKENLVRDPSKQALLAQLQKQFVVVNPGLKVSVQQPSAANSNNKTSFEELKAGTFDEITSSIGSWETISGKVRIDDRHAKSGKQCLQIAGGENSSCELTVTEGVNTDGALSFWAERWTSRAPFTFRIEKYSNGLWSEIYNGDSEVRVGRAFLSHVQVPLRDVDIEKLRFTTTSPPNTGILIDDLKVAPAVAQSITNVEVVPFTLPALIGNESSALVKLKVSTTGSLTPISITNVKGSLNKPSTECVENLQVIFCGDNSNFQPTIRFGKEQAPEANGQSNFVGKQELAEGDNFVWLACKLKNGVDLDQTLEAKIVSIAFSNGDTENVVSEPSVQRIGVAVRKRGEDGVHTCRIPGLATTNNGTLIGVYDVRRDKGRDLPGNIDVGMSRSTDGGHTWQPMRVIMDMGDDPKWSGDGIGDPSILVDRKTGTIWVSATWSHGNRSWVGSGPGLEPKETGQWMLVKSDDDGVTWSAPINITKQVKKPEWSFLLQGPGKGITMSDGTIVFPAQYQDPPVADDKTANRLPHSTFIYSRDHGETWKIATGAWDDTTEAQVIELADGELMINCRNNRASKRAIMTTTDMGQTWQQHSTHVKGLIEPGSCMASLINVGRELAWRNLKGAAQEFSSKELLLFSNPDSLSGRNHITIKASQDSGKTWPAKHHLLLDEQGGAGYSCLSMIDAETVGILYEGSQAQMTFQRVKLSDVLTPPFDQKTKNPATEEAKRPANALGVFQFARPFGDHMVMQADQPIRIWGTANPFEKINVGFDSETPVSAEADEEGNWQVELPPQPANRNPQSLVASTATKTITVGDVLIGEVWICAGQSNMEWELRKSTGGKEVVTNADDQLLRLHNCPGGARGSSGVYSEAQMDRLWPEAFSRGKWQVASPKSSATFSGVGFFFAQKLREKIDVPVGVINVSVGGTPIESWVKPSSLRADPQLTGMLDGNWLDNPLLDDWCKGRARENLERGLGGEFKIPGDAYGPNHSFKPGFMYEAGIKPFVPLSVAGVLWYQGESNADNLARIKIYDGCFPHLVQNWRAGFRNDSLPVVFVQLPAMGRPNWPLFREYQRRSLAKLSNVGMAITIDTGTEANVHPSDKQTVGERLAKWALVRIYGQDGIESGPIPISEVVKRTEKLVIQFRHVGEGLTTRDGESPLHFEIAGPAKEFVSATARIISKNQVEVSSRLVANPEFVRYAWKPFPSPTVNLTNSDDNPASPFTTEGL